MSWVTPWGPSDSGLVMSQYKKFCHAPGCAMYIEHDDSIYCGEHECSIAGCHKKRDLYMVLCFGHLDLTPNSCRDSVPNITRTPEEKSPRYLPRISSVTIGRTQEDLENHKYLPTTDSGRAVARALGLDQSSTITRTPEEKSPRYTRQSNPPDPVPLREDEPPNFFGARRAEAYDVALAFINKGVDPEDPNFVRPSAP